MTIKELQALLDDKDPESQIFLAIWDGERLKQAKIQSIETLTACREKPAYRLEGEV